MWTQISSCKNFGGLGRIWFYQSDLTKSEKTSRAHVKLEEQANLYRTVWFFCYSNFTWNLFWRILECQKLPFLTILEAFNCDFLRIPHVKMSKIPKIQNSEVLKRANWQFLELQMSKIANLFFYVKSILQFWKLTNFTSAKL